MKTYPKTKAEGTCLIIKSDVHDSKACKDAVQKTVDEYKKLNILVNNPAYQMAQKKFENY